MIGDVHIARRIGKHIVRCFEGGGGCESAVAATCCGASGKPSALLESSRDHIDVADCGGGKSCGGQHRRNGSVYFAHVKDANQILVIVRNINIPYGIDK